MTVKPEGGGIYLGENFVKHQDWSQKYGSVPVLDNH